MTKQVNIRIEKSILTEIDRITKKMLFLKTRTDFINKAIEKMIIEYLEEEARNKKK